MRYIYKLLVLSVCCVSIIYGCEKGDSDLDYGDVYIYIAQATTSGGLDNTLMVPSGSGVDTYNFKVDDQQLMVYLSVTRSGKISNIKDFSVEVSTDDTLVQEVVASIEGAVGLSAADYSLPDSVTVSGKNNYSTFMMTIPKSLLEANLGNKLVAGVKISSPSMYKLSDKNTSVAIVIDVDLIIKHFN